MSWKIYWPKVQNILNHGLLVVIPSWMPWKIILESGLNKMESVDDSALSDGSRRSDIYLSVVCSFYVILFLQDLSLCLKIRKLQQNWLICIINMLLILLKKTSNNVFFVCNKYYIQCLIKELNIGYKGRPIWFLGGGVRVFFRKKTNFEFYKKKNNP